MKTAFCPICNISYTGMAAFCNHCGAALKKPTLTMQRKYRPLQVVALINTLFNVSLVLLVYLITIRYYGFFLLGLLIPLGFLVHMGLAVTMFVFRKTRKRRIHRAARFVIAINFWALIAGILTFVLSFTFLYILGYLQTICFVISFILPLFIFIFSLLPSKDTELKELSNVF